MSHVRKLAAALILIAATAAPARADVLLIPFWGINFGGDSGKDLGEAFDAKRNNFGLSFAFMGAGIFGVETDFGYSPNFFGETDLGDSAILTGTVNLLIGIPIGGQRGFGLRPYGVFGAGIMNTSAHVEGGDFGESSVTWGGGGGVMIFFGNHWGFRFDLRYFRTFDDVEILDVELQDESKKVDFTRTSFGLIIRF